MLREELIFAATCDMSGHVRGKGFPASDLPMRMRTGIGWTPTNIMISALGPIWDTPFGTASDLMLLPDPATEVRVDFDDGSAPEHLILGDLCATDGSPWECCPRAFLRRAIAALADHGYSLDAAFEQEFVYTGAESFAASPYSLEAFRRQGVFGSALVAALRAAGLAPEAFLAEYGPRQFEITIAHQPAMAAADHGVITRELARAAAQRLGHRALFTPMIEPDGTGNGVHIHMSLRDLGGLHATYVPDAHDGLSAPARNFFAGVLHYLPALCAITAPSPVSYLRLTPNRWAPTAANIAIQDRAASLRICPTFRADDAAAIAAQFNVEYRPADATASPYLALGAIIFAGVEGLRHELGFVRSQAGQPEVSSRFTADAAVPPLPRSLDDALDALEAVAEARDWFMPIHFDAYVRAKRAEAANLKSLTPAALCARYTEAY
ncbi:MAG: glutamine synthetase family protein [Candidatus Binataceae bacterium]|jgi:glutamine synthetase